MLPLVAFLPGAQAELEEAVLWYAEREPGLESEFIRSVDASLQAIRRQPELFPVAHKNIRRALIRRFPYSIFYFQDNETLIILSIFHSSREPKKWNRTKLG